MLEVLTFTGRLLRSTPGIMLDIRPFEGLSKIDQLLRVPRCPCRYCTCGMAALLDSTSAERGGCCVDAKWMHE